MKHIVVGAVPMKMFNGGTTFTGLKHLGFFNSREAAEERVKEKLDECAGLIEIFEVPD